MDLLVGICSDGFGWIKIQFDLKYNLIAYDEIKCNLLR